MGWAMKPGVSQRQLGLAGVTPSLLAPPSFLSAMEWELNIPGKWERRHGKIFLNCPEPFRIIPHVQNAFSRKQQHSFSHGIVERFGL